MDDQDDVHMCIALELCKHPYLETTRVVCMDMRALMIFLEPVAAQLSVGLPGLVHGADADVGKSFASGVRVVILRHRK